jgi:citrate lyase gamma subunit
LKLRKKVFAAGLFSILVVALLLTAVVPAMAAGPNGGLKGMNGAPPNQNTDTLNGTLTVSDNTITITPSETPSVDLVVSSDQSVTILYDSSTGDIKGLMLASVNQSNKNGNSQNMATVKGTPSVSSNIITITPSETPSVDLVVSSDQPVTIFYDSSTGEVKGLMLTSVNQSNKNGNAQNMATAKGTLSVSSNIITITPSETPSVDLAVSSDQSITILYDSSTGKVKGLMFGNQNDDNNNNHMNINPGGGDLNSNGNQSDNGFFSWIRGHLPWQGK